MLNRSPSTPMETIFTRSAKVSIKVCIFTHEPVTMPMATTSLLSSAATWKYFDGGIAPAAGWNQPSFNDSNWSSGSGPFGYGQGSEHTVLFYGSSPNNKPASDVFRTTFTVANPHLLTDLTLKLLVDDGAAVYLNGTQIDRFNLSASATLSDFAQSSVSNAFQNSWRMLYLHSQFIGSRHEYAGHRSAWLLPFR